jgi:hypothetical protein
MHSHVPCPTLCFTAPEILPSRAEQLQKDYREGPEPATEADKGIR